MYCNIQSSICVFYVEKIHQSSSLHSYNNSVYFAVENPRKLKEKLHEKSSLCPTRYRVFLQRKYLDSV
jgi:hypothetical protein